MSEENRVIYESSADTAKKVRKELRKEFPEYPARHFSVKSSTYAGGSSVSVRWTDYPLTEDVNKVVKRFEGASFDGMQDLKTYKNYKYEGKTYSGADYVQTQRNISKERYERAEEITKLIWGDEYQPNTWEGGRMFHKVEENLDGDLGYIGDVNISELKTPESGTSGVEIDEEEKLKEIEKEVKKVVEVVKSGSEREVEGWHESRVKFLVDSIQVDKNIQGVLRELEKGYITSVQIAVRDMKNTVRGLVARKFRDTFRGILIEEDDKIDIRKEFSYMPYGTIDKIITERLRSAEARGENYRTMLKDVNLGEERNWYSNLVKEEINNIKEEYPEIEKTDEELKSEAITEEIKDISNYSYKGTEKWHDSRIEKVIEDVRTKASDGSIENRVRSGKTYTEAVKEFAGEIIKNYKEESDKRVQYLIAKEIKTIQAEYSEDEREDVENYLKDIYITGSENGKIKEGILWVEPVKEEEWLLRLMEKGLEGKNFGEGENEVGERERDKKYLTDEDKKEINVVAQGVQGWLSNNGFKVNNKRVGETLDLNKLIEIRDRTQDKSSEERVKSYEEYIFEVSRENIEEVNLTVGDKKTVNDVTKRIVAEIANEGNMVDLEGLKKSINTQKIRACKKTKYETGNFEDEVKKYIKEECRKNIKNTGEKEEESGEDAVVVNGVDIRKVVDALIEGIVTLTFVKADGTLRTMVGTRNSQYVPEDIEKVNEEEEINKQIGTGAIPLWDMQKNGMRAFRVERLKSYTVKGETIEVGEETTPEIDEEKHYDPSKLTTEQMLNVLGKSVVRLVFKKKDGTARIMWGTRAREIIEVYREVGNPMIQRKGENLDELDTEQKRQAQIAGDYIRVFDLTINEFRTFKPSALLRMDEAHNVGSWIEFKPKQDGWYNCIYSSEPITKYYIEGKRKAKDSPERENAERVTKERELTNLHEEADFTRESIARQIERAEAGKEERERKATERRDRWRETNEQIREAVATVDEYTEQDEEVYRKMKTYVTRLRDRFIDLQMEGRGRGEIRGVTSQDTHKVVMFEYDEDKYILHPRFIVNGISHRVFADRTDKIDYSNNPISSEGDTELKSELESLATLVTGKRKNNRVYAKMTEGDIRRLKRLDAVYKKHLTRMREEGIALKLSGGGDVAPHAQVSVGGKQFIISPATVYDIAEKKMIFQRERHTSTLAEFSESVKSHEQLGIEESAFKVLVSTIIFSYDLRKRIKGEDGSFI